MKKLKQCRRCGKRWCGTGAKLQELYPLDFVAAWGVTFGSKKCVRKGPKR